MPVQDKRKSRPTQRRRRPALRTEHKSHAAHVAARVSSVCHEVERIAATFCIHPRRIHEALKIRAYKRDVPHVNTAWDAAFARLPRTTNSYRRSLGINVLAAEAVLHPKQGGRKSLQPDESLPRHIKNLARSGEPVVTSHYFDAALRVTLVVYLQLKPR